MLILMKIDDYAFSGCSALTSVTIPETVTEIGEYAFENCSSLADITIPKAVTTIGKYAFYGCSSLIDITIPETVTAISDSTFSGCSSLTDITIPETVTEIGYSAFSGCSSLTSVTIPETVTEIKSAVFSGCSSLTSITIPETVTEIGYSAFSGCSSLTDITIPEAVTTIGECAFQGSGLEIIDLPESVAFIGAGAFKECIYMTDAYVRNPNCEIESYKEGQEYVVITTTTMPMYYEVDTKLYGSSYGYGGYYDAYYTFPPNITIHGYKNSTAQDYADEYSYWNYSAEGWYYDNGYNTGSYTFSADWKAVSDGLKYAVQTDGTIAITGHEEAETVTEIIIPEEISGKKVTRIEAKAFEDCSVLVSVTIPETFTNVSVNYG